MSEPTKNTVAIYITEEEAALYERLLRTEPACENDCFGEDDTISLTADFGNGYEMDIKICGIQYTDGQSNLPWLEVALFKNGSQIAYSEPCDDTTVLGEWTLTDNDGNIFTAHVKTPCSDNVGISKIDSRNTMLYYGVPFADLKPNGQWGCRLLQHIDELNPVFVISEYELLADHLADELDEAEIPVSERRAREIIDRFDDSTYGQGLPGMIAALISGDFCLTLPNNSFIVNLPGAIRSGGESYILTIIDAPSSTDEIIMTTTFFNEALRKYAELLGAKTAHGTYYFGEYNKTTNEYRFIEATDYRR